MSSNGDAIMPARTVKKRRTKTRPAVLPKETRAYAKKVEGNPKLAAKFLKDAGIIEKPGTLARAYR